MEEKGCGRGYERRMKGKECERKGTSTGDVEGGWPRVRLTVKERAQDLCGMRRFGPGRRGTE